MRTIENFEQFINPLNFIRNFYTNFNNGIDTPLGKSLEKIISQPPKHGDFRITNVESTME